MYAFYVGMLQNTPKRLYLCRSIFFSEFPAFRKIKHSSYLAAILDDVIGPPWDTAKIICTLFSRSRPTLSNKPKIV